MHLTMILLYIYLCFHIQEVSYSVSSLIKVKQNGSISTQHIKLLYVLIQKSKSSCLNCCCVDNTNTTTASDSFVHHSLVHRTMWSRGH